MYVRTVQANINTEIHSHWLLPFDVDDDGNPTLALAERYHPVRWTDEGHRRASAYIFE